MEIKNFTKLCLAEFELKEEMLMRLDSKLVKRLYYVYGKYILYNVTRGLVV